MTLAESSAAAVGDDPVIQALVGGVVIAGCNTAGALSVLAGCDPFEGLLDAALGFVVGVMPSVIVTDSFPRSAAGGTDETRPRDPPPLGTDEPSPRARPSASG